MPQGPERTRRPAGGPRRDQATQVWWTRPTYEGVVETHPWGPARRRNRAPSHVRAPPGRQTPEHAAEGRSRPAARTAARGWTRCCGADRDEGDKTEVDGRLIRLPGGHGDDTPALPRRGTTTPTTTGTTSARKGEERAKKTETTRTTQRSSLRSVGTENTGDYLKEAENLNAH